ncbi:GEVED domain-containing protein [Flavobacterium sasangense]|uniref:GEVED domain-containing protein n=1 Tax=Flavobacterium sasangense TaxID=503361 RepID=UPI00047E04FA|nr:GEVED domain-containing protein [Flavobacterium sasangense]
MKKITFILFLFFMFWKVDAQVGIIQSFPNTTTPTGWDVGAGGISTTETCATASWRGNVYNSTPKILTSETQISNGQDLTISFDYKIVDWYAGTVATTPYNGTITTQVSIDNGATWTVTAGVINDSNHIVGNTCTTVSYVVPGASVPNASNVKVRWNCVYGTTGDYYVYIDNISATQPTSTPPLCTSITSPVSGAIDVANPLVVWNSASGIPTGYRLNVGINPGGTDVLNNFDVGNVLSYYLSNLEGGTTYYVTVFPYNANGQATGCTEINFTTCDVSTIPFTEEFESITSGVPSCWGIAGTTTNSAYHFSSFATGNTGKGLRFDSWSNSNGNTSELTTPVIDASSVSSLRLKFYYKNPTGGNFEVYVSTNGGSTYTLLESGLTGAANWTLKSYVLTSYIGANLKIKFKGTSNYGSGDAYIYLDGVVLEEIPVTLPSCVAITSPANGAINVSNSTVTWLANVDATGYRISVGTTPGATDVLNNFDVGNVLSYYLSNLVGGSTYYVSVFPYNPYGQAVGCTEINFTTCDELGDFFENFDTLTATGQIPSCWSKILSNGVSTFATVGSSTTNFSAPYSISLYNSDSPATANIMLVTPYINNLSAGTNRLRFVASNSVASQDVIVGTMSNPSDANTFTPFQTVDINGTFAQYIVDFTGYTGTDDYIAIKRLSTSTYTYVYLDNVIWEAVPSSAPTCATNVVATPHPTCGNYANSITWDVTSGADGYYVTIGTTTGGNNIANAVPVSGTSYNFTGNFNTTYFYTIVPYNANGSATGCTEQSFATNVNGCYCVSAPTSVDNLGITNVQIVSTNFANTVSTSPVYNDHTATPVTMSQGVNNNVQISFDTGFGYDYNIVIWIDANDDFNLDASEIVYTGLAPNTPIVTHNASFVMPGTMPLGQHRMRIVATDVLQTPANPCYSGTYGETADFTVNIVAASCTPPAATTTVVPACGTAQYSIDVNVTALGSGTPSITDGTNSWPVSAIGVVNVGPFASGSSVNLTLLHGSDTTCNLPLGNFVYFCPPTNDTCATAIPVTCGSVVTGSTANGASNTGGNAAADVWYSYSGAAGAITVSLCNNTSFDTYLRVYDACSGTQITSNDDSCETQSQVTFTADGTSTYYIMVEGYGSNTGIFEMAVTCVLSNEDFDNSNFTAYPNPVKDVLNVSYTSEISSIRVINMIGQEVISKTINATSSQVDMSQLSAGTYIVNVAVGDAVKTLKVVKQ